MLLLWPSRKLKVPAKHIICEDSDYGLYWELTGNSTLFTGISTKVGFVEIRWWAWGIRCVEWC